MYLNMFGIKLSLLVVLELVGVLPGVRDRVLLGHHQLQAVVVVHSLMTGTLKKNEELSPSQSSSSVSIIQACKNQNILHLLI